LYLDLHHLLDLLPLSILDVPGLLFDAIGVRLCLRVEEIREEKRMKIV